MRGLTVKIDWETMRYETVNVALMVGMGVLALALIFDVWLMLGTRP
jgi:hypothetical protein